MVVLTTVSTPKWEIYGIENTNQIYNSFLNLSNDEVKSIICHVINKINKNNHT